MIKPYHIKPRWVEINATPLGFNCDFESQCYNIATPLGFNCDFESQYYNIATPLGFCNNGSFIDYNHYIPLGLKQIESINTHKSQRDDRIMENEINQIQENPKGMTGLWKTK